MPEKEKANSALLKWPRLIEGLLIKRYKRFMADVKLKNNHVVTAHCPNSGSMKECSEPGRVVYLSHHNKPSRRLKYTWEMIQMENSLVGVNTMVPNRLTEAAVLAGDIPELAGYETVRKEVKYGENSRIDLLLENDNDRCFVEIKNCTLVTEGLACFPDAVTSRGLKHLVELQKQVEKGHRSVMFYLIQRMDANRFEPADHIDPAYGEELRKAASNGVEVLVYDVKMDLEGIRLNHPVPFQLRPKSSL
ncbi:sugar fermentation stimulation protein [delta proteobacterium NaphS2]|nr:sugar fermentation stimulation protein [delta proteobacterium NaphS2]